MPLTQKALEDTYGLFAWRVATHRQPRRRAPLDIVLGLSDTGPSAHPFLAPAQQQQLRQQRTRPRAAPSAWFLAVPSLENPRRKQQRLLVRKQPAETSRALGNPGPRTRGRRTTAHTTDAATSAPILGAVARDAPFEAGLGPAPVWVVGCGHITHNTPLQAEVVNRAARRHFQVIEMIQELFSPHAASLELSTFQHCVRRRTFRV